MTIVSVNILTLPTDGGVPITDLEYRVNAGEAVSLGETTTGSYPITADEGDDIQIRAVNAVGAGDWSDVKAVPGFDPTFLFANDEPGFFYDYDDWSTLFQNTSGTQPVTAPEQGVALALDKSRGLELGPELVTNGGFDTDTFWTKGTGVTISGGVASVTSLAAFSDFVRNDTSTYTIGTFYEVSVDITAYTSGSIGFLWPAATSFFSGVGTYKFIVAATDSRIRLRTGDTFTGSIDNISVRELKGNHAFQATTAARPLTAVHPEGGVRNLLDRSEEFDNAVWTKSASGSNPAPTVTDNFAEAPNGEMTASRIQITPPADGDFSAVFQSVGFSGPAFGQILIKATNAENVGKQVALYTVSTAFNVAGTVLTLSADWQSVTISRASGSFNQIGFGKQRTTTVGPSQANAATDFLVWGAQLELGSEATPYQRRVNHLDVTEAGKKSIRRLWFNGTSHFMETPVITPGTDKAQVFAGVRPLINQTAIILENSTDANSNNGALSLFQVSGSLRFRSRGTIASNANGPSQPISAKILNGIGDISGDLATLRIDGTQVAQSTADQGIGNYLAYPAYIGAKGGTSTHFNGYIDQLISRFGPNLDTATIEKTEKYISTKSPEVPTL